MLNNSTHSTSMRDQGVTLFKDLAEILYKSSLLFIGLIAATVSDTGKSLFKEQNKLMMSLLLVLLFYSFLVITWTILQHCNRTLLPIINCALLLLGSAALVLALSIISHTIAWISLALCVVLNLALVACYYDMMFRKESRIGF